MESYRKKLKIRIIYSIVVEIIMISVMIIFNLGLISTPIAVEKDFFASFINALCTSSVAIIALKIVRYARILRNHDELRTEYIKENDELTKSIVSEIGANEYYFVVTGLALGIIIGGYVNIYVFWTFYIALMYYCIVRSVLKFVFMRKYKSIGDNEE